MILKKLLQMDEEREESLFKLDRLRQVIVEKNNDNVLTLFFINFLFEFLEKTWRSLIEWSFACVSNSTTDTA